MPRTPSASPWQAGTVVKERYRLEALLRRGGMGSVWKAEHVELRSPVALKVLEPEVARDPVMTQRFLREARAAAALRSPNVVQIFDYGVDAGQAFIAMELLVGEPLRERIARVGKLSPEELFPLLEDVLRAMHKAHEAGIVHRDLKPDNLFICKEEPEVAKVLDFGVAKVQKGVLGEATGAGTQTGMMLGTPYYMSPEQVQAKEIDRRTDLWSIAVIAFEALLGRRPFLAEALGDLVLAICTTPTPIPSLVGPVPVGFDEWFVRGTQRDPSRRFQSAREMAEELALVARSGGLVGAGRGGGLRGFSTKPVAPSRSSSEASRPPLASRPSSELDLTTGQRSAVARFPSAAAPERSGRGPIVLLLALGAVIVVGAVVFVLGGGARALHRAEVASEQHAAPLGQAAAAPAAPGATVAAPGMASAGVVSAGVVSAGVASGASASVVGPARPASSARSGVPASR